jgi:chromatin remodeling complex protein RSC6
MTATGYNHINALEMDSNKTSTKTNKMARTKKSETPATSAPVTTAATTKVAAPKKETTKKSVSKAEVTVPTVTQPTVVPAATISSEAQLASLTEKLKALSTEFTAKVREAVKATQEAAKQAKKEQRDSKKKHKKNPEQMTPEERKAWEARRSNNAFLKQKEISEELCHFMNIPTGSKRSQTEVTKFISDYVKKHKCFDENFKRRIIPNTALAKLLRVDDKTDLSYLNLQKYLKVHFPKRV